MLLASGSDDFVGAIAILAFIGLPIAYAMVNRMLAHQERMEMLRRGMVPPPDPKWAKKAAKRGWYAQAPYTAAPPPPAGPPPGWNLDAQNQADCHLRKGITLACIGFALLIGLSFIDNLTGTPGPWLLGGLIPLFAGIAQIIIALASGARLGPAGAPWNDRGVHVQQPGPQYQEQTAAYSSGPRDVTPGPYAWRPGPTTELEPGPRPPDKR